MSEIYIFSGPIRSGKTTALMTKYKEEQNTDGILCPDIEETRQVYFIQSKLTQKLQVSELDLPNVNIGKFYFDKGIMQTISDYLETIDLQENSTIIIDEVGKLELKGQGFEPGLGRIINKIKSSQINTKLIIVVRDYLVDDVILRYQLNEGIKCKIVDKTYVEQLL